MVQANAANQTTNPSTANDFIFDYLRPLPTGTFFDFQHFLVGNTRSATGANATMNWALFDGMLHKLNDPASPIPSDTLFMFSADYRVCMYATVYGPPTASATPLTTVNLPALGTAGDGVAVPLSAAYYPPGGIFNSVLSADDSTVAFFTIAGAPAVSTLYKVATAPSASPVTPTQLLAADPNATGNLTWVGISAKGDPVFTGDQGGSGANAWVVSAPGTATALDAGSFGNGRPYFLRSPTARAASSPTSRRAAATSSSRPSPRRRR